MWDLEGKNVECLDETISLGSLNGNYLNNLLDLSADMKYLWQSNLMTDITLWICSKDELYYCHKDILKFRSKWFYNALCLADVKGDDVIEVDEDSHVMEAVLCYMYTGDLRLLESLNICLVEVYEAAEKYGFSRLKEILKKMLQESKYREIMKYTQFQWILKVEDHSVPDAECLTLKNFTTYGNDNWQMKIKCMKSSEDNDYSIAIYIKRKTEKPCTVVHNVHLTVRVIDCDGKCQHVINDKRNFRVDDEYVLNDYIPLTKLMKESDNLLSDGMLILKCELTFWAKVGFLTRFKLTGFYRKYIANELFHLSEDLFNVFRDGSTHDIFFSQCHLKIHGYILQIRSCIPKDFIKELEKQAGFGRQLWTSFASFLYTGQARFLEEHGMTVYSALSEMMLVTAREKYSKFLARNLSLENAFFFLNDAVSYKDNSLSLAAANFLAIKSNIESDPQAWIRIASDKRNMLEFVPQSFIFKQF